MPRFDGKGPMGQGARSGRGLGYCRSQADALHENVPIERGVGRGGRPYGGGRGFLHGGARGNSRIRPCWRPAFGTGPVPSEMERTWLVEKVGRLQKELQQLTERLTGLEPEQNTE